MNPLELKWKEKHLELNVPVLKIRNAELFDEPINKYKRFEKSVNNEENVLTWKDRLIQGDNLYILNALLDEFKGKIKLIYIDPPFGTGEDFLYKLQIEDANNQEIKQWAYKDTWGKQITPFLNMMYPRLKLMKDLLTDDGSIYVHCDYHSSHYIKLLMDEIFGRENFQREITWNTQSLNVAGFKSQAQNWIRASDTILFYSKSKKFTYNKLYVPRSKEFIKKHFTQKDEKGSYRITRRGNKIYLNEDPGDPVTTVWNDILSFNYVAPAQAEGLGYPTQKPEALLSRIIKASSNVGDIVADFFCGSGTTALVAERLKRKWICTDLSPYAIYLTKKRILGINELQGYGMDRNYENFKPFVIQELENYYKTKLIQKNLYKDQIYLKILAEKLNLERNETIEGFQEIQNPNQIYYILPIEGRLNEDKLKEIVQNAKNAKKVDSINILIWNIEYDIHNQLKQIKSEEGLNLFVKKIPLTILEHIENPNIEIKLYDIYACKLGYKKLSDKKISFNITDFNVDLNEFFDEKMLSKVKNNLELIDFWCIDYEYNNNLKNYQWYSYKFRKKIKISLKTTHEYPESGKYTVLVKIMDILGNEYIRQAVINLN